MRKVLLSSALIASTLAIAVPAFAQDATPAAGAAVTEIPAVTIVAPEGYTVTEFKTFTADQLKGSKVFDADGGDVADIADVIIGADNQVTGVIVDVGGFLGMGEHRVLLSPDEVHIYKNSDGEVRSYVTLSKDQLKALPAYEAQ